MKPIIKKTRLEEQVTTEQEHGLQKQTGRVFGSVEELLRYDAEQITPPPAIVVRLQDSVAREPQPKHPWWRRLFLKHS